MAKRHLLYLLTLSILLLAACPLARATPGDPPAGPYTTSCQKIQLQGTTLTASCTDFFGNPHGTSLGEAPACVADKHTITNVNGTLRCVVWSEPNQGIVSVPIDVKDSQSETKVWRIDQPIVNDQNPFGYNFVKFKPGDMVSISAGGCVQTGGSGSTWKSYTTPTGDNADHYYSGMISIPGVIGSIQKIGGVLAPKEWIVPRDLPPTVLPELHLIIGYQDDNYSDNGYYAHDDGNNDQCKNVGPAWIQVAIVSDLTLSSQPKYTPYSKPFDLTWDTTAGVDANGLPLNPYWGYQLQNPGQLPDFANTCGSSLSMDTWPGSGSNIDLDRLAKYCTSQSPTSDLSTNSFDMVFGICRSSMLPGHLDWAIATYQGNLFWNEYSGDAPNDGDYNFNFFTTNKAGMSDNEDGMGLEFKGGETIDNFGNPWWHNTVGTQNYGTIEEAINGNTAVVTGLIGEDAVHGGYTESHPVFAMAIKLTDTINNDSIDEQWVYFLRNSGNGGGCSSLNHVWPGLGGAYFVSFPWPAAQVTSVQFDHSQFWKDESKAVTGGHGLYPGWSFLKFQFPDNSTEVDGVVTLHYAITPGSGKKKPPFARPAAPHVHEEDEPNFKDIAARITDPALREQFMPDLIKANPPVKAVPPKRVIVVVDNAVTEHNPPRLAGRSGELTRDKATEDPERKAVAAATEPLVDKYQKAFPKPEVK
jgi:hypothetical protein